MTDKCKHKSRSAAIDCLELTVSLRCIDCNITVSARPLTEDEINKLIKKELGRYGTP